MSYEQLCNCNFCIMVKIFRFVYGRVKDFKSASFGAQVYKFANEVQISALTKELVSFFKETNKASEVFAIFDLYLQSGNQLGCDSCKQASFLYKLAK